MRARSLLLAALLLGCASSSTRPATAPVARTATPELDAMEREFEALMSEHSLAEWHEYTGEGTPPEGGIAGLQTRERALFQRASETVAELLRRDGVDPETRRRAHLWRRGIEGLALLGDPECTALVERYEHALNAHAFVRDGRTLNRSDLQRMSRSADPAERRAAWELTAALHRDVAPVARDLLRRRAAVARAMGSTSWGDRMLSLRGVEPAQWTTLARDLATRTEEAWHMVLTEGAQARRLDRVRPWDLDFVLQREGAVADARLPADTAVDRARRVLTGWGFDLDHPPVRVVVREFSFGGQTLSIRVPTDVRTVVRPKAGAEFLRTLMHELGHALQSTRTRTPYPIARGYEWVPGLTAPGFDEGMAEVSALLIDDDAVLARYTDLTPEERRSVLDEARRHELASTRALLAQVAFERAALDDPEQDLDALQRRIDHELRGVEFPDDAPPTWAATPFLATYPVYRQSYVIAAAVAAQVHAALRERFGDRWLSPEAGRFIAETLYAPGEMIPWTERLSRATGRPLDTDALVARLVR